MSLANGGSHTSASSSSTSKAGHWVGRMSRNIHSWVLIGWGSGDAEKNRTWPLSMCDKKRKPSALGVRREESGFLAGPGLNGREGELASWSHVHSLPAVPCLLLGIPHDILSRSAHQQSTYDLCVSQAFVSCATSKVLCPLFIYQYWLLFCKTRSSSREDSGFLRTTPINHSQTCGPFTFFLPNAYPSAKVIISAPQCTVLR